MIIQLDHIPETIDDFVLMRNRTADTPEGGAAIFILAMLVYANNKDLGRKAFTVAMDRGCLKEDSNGYKGYAPAASYTFHFKNFAAKPYWAKAYIVGTYPGQGYELPIKPYKVKLNRNPYSNAHDKNIKIFIECSGSDSPRPISLRVNDKGYWKVSECSSMFLGMRAPDDNSSDDL